MNIDEDERDSLEEGWGNEYMDVKDRYCTSSDPRGLLEPLTPRERLLVVYMTLLTYVGNGGFCHYLESTYGRLLAPAQQILAGKCHSDITQILHDVERVVGSDSFYFDLNSAERDRFLRAPQVRSHLEELDVEFDGLEEEFYRDIKPYLTGEKEV